MSIGVFTGRRGSATMLTPVSSEPAAGKLRNPRSPNTLVRSWIASHPNSINFVSTLPTAVKLTTINPVSPLPTAGKLTYRGSPQTLVRSYSDRNRRSPHAIVVNPGAAEPSAGKLRTPGESHTLVRSKVAEIARALTQLTYALHVTRGLGRSSRAPGVPTAGALGLTELEEALSC